MDQADYLETTREVDRDGHSHGSSAYGISVGRSSGSIHPQRRSTAPQETLRRVG